MPPWAAPRRMKIDSVEVPLTPLPPEGVKEFAGQRGRSSVLDRPPLEKGGLVPGAPQFFHSSPLPAAAP